MVNRRDLLKTTLGAGALSMAGGAGILSALASRAAHAVDVSGYKALVCVFLFGGQDGHDTVLPYDQVSYDKYAAHRTGLLQEYQNQQGGSSRERANLLPLNPVNASQFGQRQFALPNSLSPLKTLFDSGKAAIIGNVGPLIQPLTKTDWDNGLKPAPKRLFSHNDQQSTWMSSAPEGEITGWGGKFADIALGAGANQDAIFTAISLFGNSVFLSGNDVVQYNLNAEGPPQVDGLRNYDSGLLGTAADNPQAVKILEDHYRALGINPANLFEQDIANIAERSFSSNETFSQAWDGATPLTTSFPRTPLGNQLSAVARTIQIKTALGASRQVFFVGMGGFDTHDDQATDLPNLQMAYSSAIAAFYQALVEMGAENDVTLFTASDFGRALVENGNGTDHGWGAHHFVVGGGVKGNTIYGNIPDYDLDHDYDSGEGRLIPQVSVEQYAATLGQWFGLSSGELSTALPLLSNFPVQNLGFMAGASS